MSMAPTNTEGKKDYSCRTWLEKTKGEWRIVSTTSKSSKFDIFSLRRKKKPNRKCQKCGEEVEGTLQSYLRHLKDHGNIGITFNPLCDCTEFGVIERLPNYKNTRLVGCVVCGKSALLEEIF